jgi:DNA mismatch endonuclease Vsr
MRRIGAKDTQPEIAVRRMLHAQGYRYVLHDKRLPGKPDLVFPGRCKVVFVHGCFWRGHSCGRGFRPSSNAAFWAAKINGNRARDTPKRPCDTCTRLAGAYCVGVCCAAEEDRGPTAAPDRVPGVVSAPIRQQSALGRLANARASRIMILQSLGSRAVPGGCRAIYWTNIQPRLRGRMATCLCPERNKCLTNSLTNNGIATGRPPSAPSRGSRSCCAATTRKQHREGSSWAGGWTPMI